MNTLVGKTELNTKYNFKTVKVKPENVMKITNNKKI
jgi:hypothetical protein